MPTALVTGATAGLGAAFADRLAAERHDLILVARDGNRLAETAATLRERYAVTVEVISADLATDEGCASVTARLSDPRRPVHLLVNNAGIGVNSSFAEADVTSEERVLDLHIRAVMRLTHAVLPQMLERGRGDVLNVASVAGFGPAQPGSTYSASKAWVINFSESVGAGLREYGVRVMALCPGYTRTEFHQRAGINIAPIPTRAWLRADDVVRDGLRDLRRGKLVSVPDVRYKLIVAAMRHLPHGLINRLTRDARGRLKRDPRSGEAST
ncbi:MAG: SDR family NAD(P)-dependent oxidoreductase [Micromonosporaceae bacterium]